MPSLELSKSVVLRAREHLAQHPRSGVLTRDQFVAVCLQASQQFLKNRRRCSPSRQVTPRRTVGPSDAARARSPRAGVAVNTPPWLSARDDEVLKHFVEEELERVRQQIRGGSVSAAASQLHHHAPNHKEAAADESTSAAVEVPLKPAAYEDNTSKLEHAFDETAQLEGDSDFIALHPLQVASAQLVKQRLNALYHDGIMSAAQYTDSVLGILDEAFRHPRLASVISQVVRERRFTGAIPEALRDVLIEMADAVALHYKINAEELQQQAEKIAHSCGALKKTHGVSLGSNHGRTSPSPRSAPTCDQPQRVGCSSSTPSVSHHRSVDLDAEALDKQVEQMDSDFQQQLKRLRDMMIHGRTADEPVLEHQPVPSRETLQRRYEALAVERRRIDEEMRRVEEALQTAR